MLEAAIVQLFWDLLTRESVQKQFITIARF